MRFSIYKNMERNREVALSIEDPDNPYRYLEVRGRVEEITEEGADQHKSQVGISVTGRPYRPASR